MENTLIYGDLSNKPLSERLSLDLGVSVYYPEIHAFPDGERRIRINQDVINKKVVVLKSFSKPVDSNIINFTFIVDALKRNGASKIVAITPYLPYQRADHIFRTGEGVPLDMIIKIFETLKLDRIITLDLHSIKIPEMFSIPVTHITTIPIFTEKIKEMNIPLSKLSIVSPDMGGIRRVKQITKALGGATHVEISKDRDLETGELNITHHNGEIKKVCIIIDDICSTGNTIVSATDYLHSNGAERIIVMCTHAVLSADSVNLLQNSKAEKIYMTDSINILPEKRFEKLEVVSISNLVKNSLSISYL